MHTFDAVAARRIADAVREVERRSAAELVVDVRSRSGSYAHADARFAALLALVSLAGILFMPWTVPPITVLLDPVAFYVVGIGIARWSPAVRRLFTSRGERLAAVRLHAAAAFHERGVANTTGETGVLVYVSLLERRIEVLADRGLLNKVTASAWNATLTGLHEPQKLDAETVVAAVGAIGTLLERDLPATGENADELTNVPEMQLA